MAEKYKGNTNCKIVPINNEVEKCIWNENFTWDKLPQIPENYKFVIYPVASKEHATLLIQSKDKNILLDTSLQHAKIGNRTQVRKAIFGVGAKDISIFPKEIPLQANSTCSFWMDSLMEVIVSNPKKYDSINAIEQSIENGTLWIEASVIMSNKFDENGKETIREFDNENNDDNYIKFKVGDKIYGINKNCADNRFINIKSLCKLLTKCGIKTDLKGESIADIIDKQTKKQPEIDMERPTSYKLSVKGSEALVEKISKIGENKESRKAFEIFLQIVTNKVIDYELKENQVRNESEEGKKIKKKYNTICASILDGTDTISNSDCIITAKEDARFYKTYLDTVESLKYEEEDRYLNEKTTEMIGVQKEDLLKLVDVNGNDTNTTGVGLFGKAEINNVDYSIENSFDILKLQDKSAITNLSIIPSDKRQNETIISFKTNNVSIFRDIEEIRISIQQNIDEIDQEYLNNLSKEITSKGFINDYIELGNVECKTKDSNDFKQMGQFTNGAIMAKYKSISNDKLIGK